LPTENVGRPTKITVPVLMLTTFVAKTVVPSLKVIVPVGIPVVEALTVAMNDTFRPKGIGCRLAEETKETEVAALLTVCDIAGEVLPKKVVLPSYTAVIECTPTDKYGASRVALPPERLAMTIVEPASWKST
jgi:hypothetical protein